MQTSDLPVAVIGGGPIGLAAAAHLVNKGERLLVLEAGAAVGADIRRWAHVRMFSPWRHNMDVVAAFLLQEAGWQAPDPDRLPTGGELVEQYLEPLAALPQLMPHLRLQTRVLSVARQGFDKLKTPERDTAPFLLRVLSASGAEEDILAKAVIDASGTYSSPNPLGASGIAARGEGLLAQHIFYGIPDVLGMHRERYVGRTVLVVGSGHSAFNALLDLVELANQVAGTEIIWAVRRRHVGQLFGGEALDHLPARGDLGSRIRHLVEAGKVRLMTGFQVGSLTSSDQKIVVASEAQTLPPVDEIIAATGFRPNLSLFRELRLALDPIIESPVALAPLIDPNLHSCGTAPPHGALQLAHPEKDFYIVGMKSYGRAPTFLLLTGYEQVRSVVCAITGDTEGARAVQLELPATGVCSTDGLEASCCSSEGLIPLAVLDGGHACCSTAEGLEHTGAAPRESRGDHR
jgi:thioredoxin reductase